jgi:molybdate transport repressor ModE-like protein
VAGTPAEWSDLRILLALSRAGSMVGAAKTLKVEHTTVGRRMNALEDALGVRLVTRTRAGVTLTDAGRAAVRAAEAMEQAESELTRQLARTGAVPEGNVSVSLTDSLVPIVTEHLRTLAERYPRLEVSLSTSTAVVQLERGAADLALRFTKPTEPSLVAKKISDLDWSLYGAGEYVTRRGTPAAPDALCGHDLIGFGPEMGTTRAARWYADTSHGARIVARASSVIAMRGMVAAGLGLGVLPGFVASDLARCGPPLFSVPLYAVVHEDLRDEPRVRVVLDHLAQTLGVDPRLAADGPRCSA